jgi:hypothetical protein
MAQTQTEHNEEGSTMKKFGFATLAASALTAAIVGLADPAEAAPTGTGNAQDVISSLEKQGFNVIVNHVGSTPLNQATVVGIPPGQTYSRTDSGAPGAEDDAVTIITGKTVYVDVR